MTNTTYFFNTLYTIRNIQTNDTITFDHPLRLCQKFGWDKGTLSKLINGHRQQAYGYELYKIEEGDKI